MFEELIHCVSTFYIFKIMDDKVINIAVKQMADILEKGESKYKSKSIAAVLIDDDGEVIHCDRNRKINKDDKKATHAESFCLEKITKKHHKNLNLFVTNIPCIKWYKKIIKSNLIKHIYILTDYKNNLVRGYYLENKLRKIPITRLELDSHDYKRIIYHFDASTINEIFKKNKKDIEGKIWWTIAKDKKIVTIGSYQLSYIDTEKILLVSKYVDKDIIKINDKDDGINFIINTEKLNDKINGFLSLYKKEFNKNNKLVNLLEKITNDKENL